tara:strand:+ start:783 stop:995 length:213 start_codon:yes stop_codon:yes gene_type:complete
MKFILVYTICSFLNGQCLPEITHPKTFNSWSECSQAGLSAIKESLALLPDKNINNNRLGGRYICQEINAT